MTISNMHALKILWKEENSGSTTFLVCQDFFFSRPTLLFKLHLHYCPQKTSNMGCSKLLLSKSLWDSKSNFRVRHIVCESKN